MPVVCRLWWVVLGLLAAQPLLAAQLIKVGAYHFPPYVSKPESEAPQGLLLDLLATGGHSGRASLQVLAAEAGVPADDAFLAQGQAMLQRMHEEGTVLGTRL